MPVRNALIHKRTKYNIHCSCGALVTAHNNLVKVWLNQQHQHQQQQQQQPPQPPPQQPPQPPPKPLPLQPPQQQKNTVKQRLFKCNYCDKILSGMTVLKAHERIHTKDTPYKCTFCGKQFNTNQNRIRHETAIHKSTDVPKHSLP